MTMIWSVSRRQFEGRPLVAHAWLPARRPSLLGDYMVPICRVPHSYLSADNCARLVKHTTHKNKRCAKCLEVLEQTLSPDDVSGLTITTDATSTLEAISGFLGSMRGDVLDEIRAWLLGLSRLEPLHLVKAVRQGLEDVAYADEHRLTEFDGVVKFVFLYPATITTARTCLEALSVALDGALERGLGSPR